jgi:pimeloyl-ACP methyl ester carboxylesterase
VHGDQDRIIPVSHSRKLASANTKATLIELPGGDHNTLRDTNPEIEEIVIKFLRENL